MNKRKLFFALLLPLLTVFAAQVGRAQCTTNAGFFLNPINAISCGGNGNVEYLHSGSQTLDANDAFAVVLHDGTATTLGNIIAVSPPNSPQNLFYNNVVPGVYHIAAIAGNSTPAGGVDPLDPCFSMKDAGTLAIKPTPEVTIATPSVLTCAGGSVQLQATVNPPGNYNVGWQGEGLIVNSNTLNPTVNVPGLYYIYVYTSGTNCQGFAQVLVEQEFPVNVSLSISGACTENQEVTVTNFLDQPGYTYLWSNGSTAYPLTVLPLSNATTYCATITNSTGCEVQKCVIIEPFKPFTAEITAFQGGCADSLNSIYVISTQSIYGFQWQDGSTNWGIQNPVPGEYAVTVTNWSGCTATDAFFLETAAESCGQVQGYVFADLNSSCTYDAGDLPFKATYIEIINAQGNVVAYGYSDEQGFWTSNIAPGTYTIRVVATNSVWEACELTHTVTVAPDETIIVPDFLLKPYALCSALSVDLSTPFLRRCFNSLYHVSYCNEGTINAENAYIEVELDDLETIVGATLPYTNIGNNKYRFELGTVDRWTCDGFWIQVFVDCNANPAQSLCSTATIYPNAPCGPQFGQWSGASLQITALCNADSVDFTLKNVGTAPMSNPLEYVVIEDAVMFMQAPPPVINLDAQEAYTIRVPANGSTWRVEAEQEPNHPGFSMPSLAVEGCTTGQTFSTGYINLFPLDDADPWLDEECVTSIGSYDPNDKQGIPVGYGDNHQIRRNTDLEYMIRFQNTGTDTAFTVVIRDTISAWLDPTTIRLGASSHQYDFDFYGTGSNIKFVFNQINLPDSAANFAGSQGFVTYRISQRAAVPFGSDIYNNAAIYFDFNKAVITNTTQHRVDTNFMVVVSAWEPKLQAIQLQCVPNPTSDIAWLELKNGSQTTPVSIEVLDTYGRTVRYSKSADARWKFERNDLPAGLYTIRVTNEQGLIGIGKLMIQ